MRYFPINVDLKNRFVVVVGGGTVGWRKCRHLLEADPRITVIAPDLCPPLRQKVSAGAIHHVERDYRHGDLAGAFLVIAATDDFNINRRVADEAGEMGALVSVADDPGLGNFTMPAFLTRGDLLVTVSTGGKSPGFSRVVRDRLGEQLGAEYAITVDLLGRVREKLLTRTGASAYNNKILNDFTAIDLPALLRNDCAAIDRLLVEHFGPDFSLEKLGLREQDLL